LVQRALGRGIVVKILANSKPAHQVRSGIDNEIRDLPAVREAIELFDASVIETHTTVSDVKPPEKSGGSSGDQTNKEQ
jgi:hypothetical protein